MSLDGAVDALREQVIDAKPFGPGQEHGARIDATFDAYLYLVDLATDPLNRIHHLRGAYMAMAGERSPQDWVNEAFLGAIQAVIDEITALNDVTVAPTIAQLREDQAWLRRCLTRADDPMSDAMDALDEPMTTVTSCPAPSTSAAAAVDEIVPLQITIEPMPKWHAAVVNIHVDADTAEYVVGQDGFSTAVYVPAPASAVNVWLSVETCAVQQRPSEGGPCFRLLPTPCHLTCTASFSLPVKYGCLTGFNLVQLVHGCLRVHMAKALQSPATLPNIRAGADWLRVSGLLQELSKPAKALLARADPGGTPWFNKANFVYVGVTDPRAVMRTEGSSARHPRIVYGESGDLAYTHIPAVLTQNAADHVKAADLLELLRAGTLTRARGSIEVANDCAFLVHVFGVEANKNNLAYVTAVMGLEMIQAGLLTFREFLLQIANVPALAGSGGLFGMASFKLYDPAQERGANATLDLLQTTVHCDTQHEGAAMAELMRLHVSATRQQDWVIPMKEMLTIVRWCIARIAGVREMDLEVAVATIVGAVIALLNAYYPVP